MNAYTGKWTGYCLSHDSEIKCDKRAQLEEQGNDNYDS